jgi:hypothetical protein
VRLSDIMGHMHLDLYPQIALVIFGVVFVVIAARTFSGQQKSIQEQQCQLPLEDDTSISQRGTL